VKLDLNDCNYVLQKLAKSRPFVVHVDHMRKCNLHGQSDSNAENSDLSPLSDDSTVQRRSLRSRGRMSKADIHAHTPSESIIAHQSVKSDTAAKPAN